MTRRTHVTSSTAIWGLLSPRISPVTAGPNCAISTIKPTPISSVRLLSNIQEKSRRVTPYRKLRKLSAKILEPAIKRFHNRGTRKQVTKAMEEAAASGRLLEVLNVIDNVDVINNDELRFRDAMNEYALASSRLAQLEADKHNRTNIARELGAQVSLFVSGVMTTIALIGIFAASFLF